MRIWRHSCQSALTRQLIFSPDTDVYIIGLTHLSTCKDIYIEISTLGSKEKKLLHLNQLTNSLTQDPDLAAIPLQQLPLVLQTLYAATGCDYTSFFSGLGKSTFLKAMYKYATFIGPMIPHSEKEGYLSFLRLVGSAYIDPVLLTTIIHVSCSIPLTEKARLSSNNVAWLDSI